MSYADPMTGGADMSITFKNYEDTKWLVGHLKCGKIFGSWMGNSICFFKKDEETIRYLLPDKGMEYEIKTIEYMSIEDAINRTIK